MKTLKQVLAENQENKTLIRAVINRIGLDNVNDINNHGIAGGYPGFVYYSDTHRFAMRHRKAIVNMLEDQAYAFGEDVLDMVSGFGIFRKNSMDSEDKKELYKYIGGSKCKQSTITNLMAWYAAEEVCRLFES
jgi:hypothetical protein